MILRGPAIRKLFAGERVLYARPAPTDHCPYVTGRSYPVFTAPKKPAVARAKVQAVTRVGLHELEEHDARAQGFDTLEELYAWWREHHRDGPLSEPPVWVVELRLDIEEAPRFLHRRVQRGYTSDPNQAAAGEPEALSPAELKRYAKEATYRLRERWEKEDAARRRLELHDRLALLREEARARGVNVSKHERVIEKRLDAIEDELRAARGERAA